jgi:hypothetical protein
MMIEVQVLTGKKTKKTIAVKVGVTSTGTLVGGARETFGDIRK